MNLASIIDAHPAEAVAVVSEGQVTTYGELRELTGRCRGALAGLGVRPGDRVGLACGNELAFVVSYLAVLGTGAVTVLLNPLAPPPELRAELVATGCSVLIAGPTARAAREMLDGDFVDFADFADLRVVGTEQLTDHDPVDRVDRAEGDLAALLFTSGTAGSPRAAMLTHGNLLANLRQIQEMPGRRQHPDDVVFGVIPLFHVFGLNVVLGTTLFVGARVVLVDRFDAVETLAALAEQQVTVLSGPPTMWAALAAQPDGEATTAIRRGLSSLRLAVSGAAKLGLDTATAVHERFGLRIDEGYGLTEAAPVVTAATGTDAPMGSIGLPLPGIEVRVVDALGQDVVVGDVGEIWVRGPNVFPGYWNDDAATAAALTAEGWLRTGDLAVVDEAGFLFLVDRAKDLIIVSGFNVYPGEVEEVLAAHPAVLAAAVVGVPDVHTGEAIRAFVTLEPGADVGEDELIAWCGTRLARYKAPVEITFRDDLPHNPAGKLLRRALR